MNTRTITLEVTDSSNGRIIYYRTFNFFDQVEACIEEARESWDIYQKKQEEKNDH